MRGSVRGKGFAVAMSIAVVLLPAGLHAETPDEPPAQARERGIFTPDEIIGGVAVGFDLVVLRPLSVVATAIGFTLFMPVAVMSLAGYPDTVREAWELFVSEPAKNVYERPLGDL